uniref:Uncharacterized protein n=1 Tax=Spermothamnion repens TaxID=31383 RepID=A0A4D6WYI0_9FLOR|nr:hypothetical protein [Spermothamnion repens]
MLKNYYRDFRPFHNFQYCTKKDINYIRLIHYDKYKPFFISKNINNKIKGSKFISRNFWQKIVNQYWQETIYLSISNIDAELYMNKLRSSGLSVYKGSRYKYFLTSFNKALLSGNIFVSLDNFQICNSRMLDNKAYLKYIWHKKLYLYFFYLKQAFYNIKHVITISNYIRRQKIKRIYNSIPLFSLINNNNKIIMAESSDQVLINQNWLNIIFNHYFNFFFQNFFYKKIYTSLFFMNFEDAIEYKNHIENKYLFSSRENHTRIFISPLFLYYRLLNLVSGKIDFRIIPDLQEVSNLLNKYKNYSNIFFAKNQKYGSDYFQGQPIYIIEPVLANSYSSKEKKKITYYYSYSSKKNNNNYKAIFFNYETAIMAWNKFKEKNMDYILPHKPILQVSSLENLLNLYIINSNNELPDHSNYDEFIAVPSLETYNFIKNSLLAKQKYSLKDFFLNKVIRIQQLTTRIMWSLTSRQPKNY